MKAREVATVCVLVLLFRLFLLAMFTTIVAVERVFLSLRSIF